MISILEFEKPLRMIIEPIAKLPVPARHARQKSPDIFGVGISNLPHLRSQSRDHVVTRNGTHVARLARPTAGAGGLTRSFAIGSIVSRDVI
jgi:hypothetical protein